MFTNKIGSSQKCKISKVLERKLGQTANEYATITAVTLVSDAANSGVTVWEKTVTRAFHRKGIHTHRPWKTPLLKERYFKSRLNYA